MIELRLYWHVAHMWCLPVSLLLPGHGQTGLAMQMRSSRAPVPPLLLPMLMIMDTIAKSVVAGSVMPLQLLEDCLHHAALMWNTDHDQAT
jgi:hypothetical protein